MLWPFIKWFLQGCAWFLLRHLSELCPCLLQGECPQSQSWLGGPGFCQTASVGDCRLYGASLQDANMNKTGQFRFTPPTHTLLAFKKALEEYHAEGGLEGRMTRWPFFIKVTDRKIPISKVQSKPGCVENWDGQTWLQRTCAGSSGEKRFNLIDSMIACRLAISSLASTTRVTPTSPLKPFTQLLENEVTYHTSWQLLQIACSGQVIYPGKVTDASCFRIGNIGNLEAGDMATLLIHIQDVLAEMGIPTPVS